jgi:hypothetical protein
MTKHFSGESDCMAIRVQIDNIDSPSACICCFDIFPLPPVFEAGVLELAFYVDDTNSES